MIGKVTRPRHDVLDMWVVYRHPSDHPDKYVARMWIHEAPVADAFVVADTLGEIQAALIAAGRICLQRYPADDPVIVETWL